MPKVSINSASEEALEAFDVFREREARVSLYVSINSASEEALEDKKKWGGERPNSGFH